MGPPMTSSLSVRWQAQQRFSIFLHNILLVLGETEARIQREEVLKQISNAKRSADS
jgi:hypothetical protein